MIIDFALINYKPINRFYFCTNIGKKTDRNSHLFMPDMNIYKVMAFTGYNCAGKTNFISAMKLLSSIVCNVDDHSPNIIHKDWNYCSDRPTIFKIRYIMNGNIYQYHLEVDKEKIIKEKLSLSYGYELIYSRNLDKIEIGDKNVDIAIKSNQSLLSVIYKQEKTFHDSFSFFKNFHFFLNNEKELMDIIYIKTKEKKYKESLKKFLKHLDFSFKDFYLKKEDDYKFINIFENNIEIEENSSAIEELMIIHYFLNINNNEKTIIFIDDFLEHSHNILKRGIIEYIQENCDFQLFLTTRDTYFLKIFTDKQIITMDRNN